MLNQLSEKIVFLFTPGPIGGAEKVIVAGLREMVAQGKEAELWLIKETRVPKVMNNFLELLKGTGIKVLIFDSPGIFSFKLLKQLNHALINEKPQIIHAHGFKAIFYAYLANAYGSRLVVTHHGKTSHTFKVKIYEMIETFIMKHSHAVIVVSKKMQAELLNDGIHHSKIFLVENILSLNNELTVLNRNKKINLLFAGRLSPEKGCHILIEAVSKVPVDVRPNITILGDGVDREILQTHVSKFGLESTVHFKGFQKDISSFLEQSDGLVMPSLREGQPMSLIEACCSGLPVIGSDVGGIPELVQHGNNGILCKPGNSEDLASKLIQFVNMHAELKKKALVKTPDFRRRFSPDTWVKETQKIYDTVLSQL